MRTGNKLPLSNNTFADVIFQVLEISSGPICQKMHYNDLRYNHCRTKMLCKLPRFTVLQHLGLLAMTGYSSIIPGWRSVGAIE